MYPGTRKFKMFEATANPAARNAMQDAHAARGEAMVSFLKWLFPQTFR
jgi:hypothetical protein